MLSVSTEVSEVLLLSRSCPLVKINCKQDVYDVTLLILIFKSSHESSYCLSDEFCSNFCGILKETNKLSNGNLGLS